MNKQRKVTIDITTLPTLELEVKIADLKQQLAEKQEYIHRIGDILGQGWRCVSLENHAKSIMQQLAAKDAEIERLKEKSRLFAAKGYA